VGRAESSALTGKGLTYGGSKIRQEAAGFGTVYFLERMLEHQGERLAGKVILLSGFGNMAWGVCRKATELGGKVITLSGPDGYVYDRDGVCTQEKFDFMIRMRESGVDCVQPYAERFGAEFFPGRKPWERQGDVAIPCATQNEIDIQDAVMILSKGVRYYVEAANMPATAQALKLLRLSPKVITAGSKAAGCGGVAVSALEMAQNSIRYSWSRSEVDEKLRGIMSAIYDASAAAAEEYGATGWVKNEADESVSMELQGSEKQLRRVLDALNQNDYIRIDRMESEPLAVIPKERKFEIKF
jgi:glutamate dehydrogenase (NADP+)